MAGIKKSSFIGRLPGIIHEVWDIVRKVLVYVLIGIGIGVAMHGYVPEDFLRDTWLPTNDMPCPLP